MFNIKIVLAIIVAAISYYMDIAIVLDIAKVISDIFINFLKLISLPMIFFSIVTTISGLKNSKDINLLTKKTLLYSLCTTVIATSVSCCVYFLLNPIRFATIDNTVTNSISVGEQNYLEYILSILPDNFIKVFLDNNIIGCTILAFLVGYSLLYLSDKKYDLMCQVVSAICDILFQISRIILKFMPIAIWAFITIFLYSLSYNNYSSSIIAYLICVLLSNFIQAFIVLPLLLKYKKIPIIHTVKSVLPVFYVAFFSKSSSATLPTTMEYLKNNLKVDKKVYSFVLPMCTAINMNACAAFIFTTVMFVSEMNGYSFSFFEILLWIFLSVVAALGNAGVPMGCYFMATSYLVSMKIPLHIMGVILPFYSLLDMLETAINVWSDICITQIVNKEYSLLNNKKPLK